MTFPHKDLRRCGHTIIELVTAMVASAILLVGLGSVMLIARQIAYTPSASTQRLEASKVIGELSDELRLATYITERAPNLLAFVVADRDADGTDERIRYEWSGTPGDPLMRTYNGGDAVPVLDSVQDFNLDYTIETSNTSIETTTDSAEVLLLANTNLQLNTVRNITSSVWSAQQIDPSVFVTPPPADALSWNATRVEFQAVKGSLPTTAISVQLRSAGAPYNGPTSQVLGNVNVLGSSLTSSLDWNAATFPTPVRDLALHRKYALAWTSASAVPPARLRTDTQAASGVLESDDAGASWQFMSTKQVYYRLYGTYTTPGPTYDVSSSHLSNIDVRLQTGTQTHSRVEASISLANRPQVLSAYWHTDFDSDPTSSDSNGDGVADWQAATADEVVGSVPYDGASMSGGVWHVTGKLRTDPLNDFVEPTTVEVRFRDTSLWGSGAIAWINADWQGGLHAPLAVGAVLQDDGTQSLWLMGKINDATEVSLFEMHKLPSDFIRCRLTIVPDNDVVNVNINGEDVGTFSYPTYAPSSTDQFVAVYGDTSTAEFDYVEVGVAESN